MAGKGVKIVRSVTPFLWQNMFTLWLTLGISEFWLSKLHSVVGKHSIHSCLHFSRVCLQHASTIALSHDQTHKMPSVALLAIFRQPGQEPSQNMNDALNTQLVIVICVWHLSQRKKPWIIRPVFHCTLEYARWRATGDGKIPQSLFSKQFDLDKLFKTEIM